MQQHRHAVGRDEVEEQRVKDVETPPGPCRGDHKPVVAGEPQHCGTVRGLDSLGHVLAVYPLRC